MADLILVAMILVVPIAAVLLARTRLWWLTGALVIASGIAMLASTSAATSGSHDGGAEAGIGAVAMAFTAMIAAVCWVYGAILIALCAYARRRRARRAAVAPPPELPPARIHHGS